MSKYLTIITNFGGADVGVPPTTLSSLDKLKAAVRFEKAKAVRVTGGGDPLHEYEKHQKYFRRLFKYCREIDIPVELHTGIHVADFPYEKCMRVVYHGNAADMIQRIPRHGHEGVAIEFVVGKGCTLDLIDKVADICEASDVIDELHFRAEGGKSSHLPKSCREYLRAGHGERWQFIEKVEETPPYFINGEIRYSKSDISE